MPAFITGLHWDRKPTYLPPEFFAADGDLYDFEYESDLKVNIERGNNPVFEVADIPRSAGPSGPCRHQAAPAIRTESTKVLLYRDEQKRILSSYPPRDESACQKRRQIEVDFNLEASFAPYRTLDADAATQVPAQINTWEEHKEFMDRNNLTYR